MDSRAVRTFRFFAIVTAIVAIVLGLIALFRPGATLVAVAILFGIYLVVAGVLRVTAAVRGRGTSPLWRWISGIVGALVAIAGLVCLIDPSVPLALYALMAGIGFVLEGIVAFVGGFAGVSGSSRTLAIVSGVLSILGGIAVLIAPAFALSVFMRFAGIALILVGIGALLLLPRTKARL